MKIDPLRTYNPMDKNTTIEKRLTTNEIRDKANTFKEILTSGQVNKKEKMSRLNEWLGSLENLRERLRGETTNENLMKYKDSVKSFLEYYIENEIYLEEKIVKDGPFHTKQIRIIKNVNEKMSKLTEELLGQQAGNLEILRLTGDIQGLLFELVH